MPPNTQQPPAGGYQQGYQAPPNGGQGYQPQAAGSPQMSGPRQLAPDLARQAAGGTEQTQFTAGGAPASAPRQAVGPGGVQNAPVTPPPPAGKTNPNSTQNALLIAEIRDGIVIMGDGSYRSVVMVKSINYDLMSRQEQESVEYAYQGFLNSLYFPVQIFIRSQRVDLQPYVEKLDQIRSSHDNMLLAMLMDDYIGYIDQLAQQANIMNKKFYICIPYFPHVQVQKAFTQSKNFFTGFMDMLSTKEKHVVVNEEDLQKAKDELRTRVQAVLSGLLQCGIKGLPLDTQELIELFYDSYNPDTATRQQLKNFDELSADVITRGEGPAPQQQTYPAGGQQQ